MKQWDTTRLIQTLEGSRDVRSWCWGDSYIDWKQARVANLTRPCMCFHLFLPGTGGTNTETGLKYHRKSCSILHRFALSIPGIYAGTVPSNILVQYTEITSLVTVPVRQAAGSGKHRWHCTLVSCLQFYPQHRLDSAQSNHVAFM